MSIPRFRAWHKQEKKMYYAIGRTLGKGKTIDWFSIYDDESWCLEGSDHKVSVSCNNGILMQSTGLKDKNGKEIFEGDIVKTDSDYKTLFVVVWCNEENMMACFCGENIKREGKPKTVYYLHKGSHIEIQYLMPMEVIGNIHENPKLLKGVKL